MDSPTRMVIEALHQARLRWVLALAGGGTEAAGLILNVPGASRTILEVVVPYHDQALAEFLGEGPEQSCSVGASRDMALRCYQRAGWLVPGERIAGLGCTAALVTDRPKKGDHRFFLTTRTAFAERTYSLTLAEGQRDREGEETILDVVLLNALAEAAGLSQRVAVPLLPGEEVQVEERQLTPLHGFFQGRVDCVCVESDGRQRVDAPTPRVVLAGAFNPAHAGHWGLAASGSRLVGAPAAFELCAINVDKPPLTLEEVTRRLQQFHWHAPVWVTRAPTFVDKAKLFPGAVFVVGADTAERIISPRYYPGGESRMLAAFAAFRERGCRFLVAGRVSASGSYVVLDHLAVPAGLRDLFTGISEAEFRLDFSSTALREYARQGGTS